MTDWLVLGAVEEHLALGAQRPGWVGFLNGLDLSGPQISHL